MTIKNRGDELGSSFAIGEGQKIIVDSGTSFILMPEGERARFV
jgi:hypothetical protein